MRDNKDDRIKMLPRRMQRVEQNLTRRDVSGSGAPGILVPLHPCEKGLGF
ncbi:MAG: hypothetical protein ABIW94_09275 [Gemmatimonadaceae bacterium]